MVAAPVRRRALLSIIVLASMLAPSLPLVAQAQAQLGHWQLYLLPNGLPDTGSTDTATLPHDGAVDDSRITIDQSTPSGHVATDVHFLNGASQFTLNVKVYNEGTVEANAGGTGPTRLPLYYWFKEARDQGWSPYLRCFAMSHPIPAATRVDDPGDGTPAHPPRSYLVPGSWTFQIKGIPIPTVYADPTDTTKGEVASLNLMILVNPVNLNGFNAANITNANQVAGGACPQAPSGPLAQDDLTKKDNIASVQIVKNAKMDLRIAGLDWCANLDTTAGADCARDGSQPFNITNPDLSPATVPWNSTRQFENDATLSGTPPPPPYNISPNSSVFFRAKVYNDVGTEADPVVPPTSTVIWGSPATPAREWQRDNSTCPFTTVDEATPQDSSPNTASPDCKGFKVHVDFHFAKSDAGVTTGCRCSTLASPVLTSPVAQRLSLSDPLSPVDSGFFDLKSWSGPFILVARINEFNDDGSIAQWKSSNDEAFQTFEVNYVDLVPDVPIASFKTRDSDPYPYPLPGETTDITGLIFLNNTGNAPPLIWDNDNATFDKPPVQRRPIVWTATIDNKSSGNFADTVIVNTDSSNAIENSSAEFADPVTKLRRNATMTRMVHFHFSSEVGAPDYIEPGRHGLCVQANVAQASGTFYKHDPANPSTTQPISGYKFALQRESNTTNNKYCISIVFSDTQSPVFAPYYGVSGPKLTNGPSTKDDKISSMRPNETLIVVTNATDDNQAGLTVIAHFTSSDDPNAFRNYTLVNIPQQPYSWTKSISGFNFSIPNATVQNWTVVITAEDTVHNKATSTPAPLKLTRWPIQTVALDTVVKGIQNENGGYYPNDATFQFAKEGVNPPFAYTFYLNDSDTGVVTGKGFDSKTCHCMLDQIGQPNITENLAFTYIAASGKKFSFNGTAFTNFTYDSCTTDNSIHVGGTTTRPICSDLGHFAGPSLSTDTQRDGGPGRWYAELAVKDLGGDVRVFNRTFTLKDFPPELKDPRLNATELEPGQTLFVRVNVTDDIGFNDTAKPWFVNFTRKDNLSFSFALRNSTSGGADGRSFFLNDTVTTGFGGMLNAGGDYQVRFSTVDVKGNWNHTDPIPFSLKDSQAPSLDAADVDQSSQEVGANVTFFATATDKTNVTVHLRVHPTGTDEDTVRVNLTPEAPGSTHFSYMTNFSAEGSFVWSIYAEDSVGLTSSVKTGTLTIASNLGPRFDVSTPPVASDGARYAKAAPQIGFVVYDTNGVIKNSIHMMVGGFNVTTDNPVPLPVGPPGYIVNYTVPASAKFQHKQVVPVNITAQDNSSKQLVSYLNFTFTVDDVAPIARVKAFDPKYRASDTDLTWNVSLKTRFTLEATDDDGVPNPAPIAMKYRIFGGGNNQAETTYTTPFTIAEAPGVYTGPKVYQIQFIATDYVGNVNKSGGRDVYETLNVFVDDIPPTLDPFGSLPQGRFINATFIDDRSGVKSASVWTSVSGGPYAPTALDLVNGVWSTVLPEGKKGDRISYYLEASDNVGNTETFGNATEPYATYLVGNHVPKLKLTSPTVGSKLARSVDVAWDASDEDADALSFTVYLKAPGKATYTEISRLDSTDARHYILDTTKYADGDYTIRVTATDGSFVALSETTVSILNRANPIERVDPVPPNQEVGRPILLTVQVSKAQARVEALLFKDGVLVGSFPMNDEGRDGDLTANDQKYSARVTLDQSGKYSIQYKATYQEDGVQKEATVQGATVDVAGQGVGNLGLWLVGIGLVVAIGIGVLAVVLVRRRR